MDITEMQEEIERLKHEYEGCYEAFAKLTGACADRDEVIAELRQALEWYAEQAKTMQKATLHVDNKVALHVMKTLALDGGKRAADAAGEK